MKISLSKKGDPRGRHLILICSLEESYEAHPIIKGEILKGKANPVKEFSESGKVLYRFNMRYADQLALAFPMADFSDAMHRRLKRAEEKRLEGMEVPKLKIPGFEGKLYDFQKIAAKMIIDGTIDLLNDEMGLGKTFMLLAAIRKLKAFPALIAVPNNAKYTWEEVINEFFDMECVVYDTATQSPAERAAVLEKRAQVTIINIEAMRAKPIVEGTGQDAQIVGYDFRNPALFDFEWAFFSVDEHHRVKNPEAQVTHGFFQIKSRRELHMSGTPILNRPEEIWSVLHRLYPDEFDDFATFVDVLAVKNGERVMAYKPDAMAELRKFLHTISLRRRKDQVLKDLPKVIEVPRRMKLTEEAQGLYDEIRDDLLLRLETGEIKTIKGVLPQITRLKQACFSPELYGGSRTSAKIDELKEIVRELTDNKEKAIIFSQWSRATRIVQRELEQYNPAYVDGTVPLRVRQLEMKRFNTDPECKLYIGTIGANREAINLGVATYVIFTDEDWTPAANDQAIGRSAAGGLRGLDATTKKVHVIKLQAEDTIEQRIELLLRKKRALFDRTVERDGGRKIKTITVNDIKDLL